MDTTKTAVDHQAITETIHKWMKESPGGMMESPGVLSYTTQYGYVARLQARCDELDWRLSYARISQTEDGMISVRFSAVVKPHDANRDKRIVIKEWADTLPLAICLAIEAAIKELKPEPAPTQELDITHGDKGRVSRVWLNAAGVRTGESRSVMRRCRSEHGEDGILFGGAGAVHITDVDQCCRIIRWLIDQRQSMMRQERLVGAR